MGSGRKPLDLPAPEARGSDTELIARAYTLFDGPPTTDAEVCTSCCLEPDFAATLFDRPNRTVPLADIQAWMGAAAEPRGISRRLSRYLLPRVVELILQGAQVHPLDPALTLERFQTGDETRWGREERMLLARFEAACLDRWRADAPGGYPGTRLDDALCMLARAGQDVDPALRYLWSWPDRDLFHALARDWGLEWAVPHVAETAFWQPGTGTPPGLAAQAKRTAAWFRSPQMQARARKAAGTRTRARGLSRDAGFVLSAL